MSAPRPAPRPPAGLKSRDPRRRAAAVRSLGDRRDEAAARALLGILAMDPEPAVRRAAAETLGEMGTRSPLHARAAAKEVDGGLLACLESPDFPLRRAAAVALGRLGAPKAAPALLAMLVRDRAARGTAAAVLMRLPNAQGEIAEALRHRDPEVRLAAATAIAAYVAGYDVLAPEGWRGWFQPHKGTERVKVNAAVRAVVDALGEAAEDGEARVRQAAAEALETIRRKLEKRLRGVVDEWDDDFRSDPEEINFYREETPEERRATSLLRAARGFAAHLGEAVRGVFAVGEPAREPPSSGEEALAPARYTDLTLHPEAMPADPLPPGRPLRAGDWYRLRVAVRARPIGVRPAGGPRRPLREPRQSAPATLHVAVEGGGFEVEEPVDTLELPPAGDSTRDASFRVRPRRQSTGTHDLAELRVRLYYQFNLLEELVLQAEVVGQFDEDGASRLALPEPVSFRQTRREREILDLDDVQPRALHVDVCRAAERYLLRFTFWNDRQRKVEFLAPAPLQASDLEDLLVGARETWYAIAMSDALAAGVAAPPDEFAAMTRRLAELGRQLWVRMFSLERQGAMSKVGDWLHAHPLASGAIVQVSLAKEAAGFVFPWALLYDRPLPAARHAPVDLEGFWGMRYAIEQRPAGLGDTDAPVRLDGRLELGRMQWESFRNIALQNALMEELAGESGGRLAVSQPPVVEAEACYALLGAGGCHILYFYAHGYTRRRSADARAGRLDVDLDLFLRRYEELPPGSPLRAAYEPLYGAIRRGELELDRSWIELSYGKLYLDELYARVPELGRGPLVVLNLCESAQVTPALADSFVHFFLDRGARAVVGTECPMTVEFAHPFSERFLRGVLAGQTAGEALLDVRRHFMAGGNPLGLAYTLFGLATARFEPAPLAGPSLHAKEA